MGSIRNIKELKEELQTALFPIQSMLACLKGNEEHYDAVEVLDNLVQQAEQKINQTVDRFNPGRPAAPLPPKACCRTEFHSGFSRQ